MDPSFSSFNPRPPRGGRPEMVPIMEGVRAVSIHAPRAEGDLRSDSAVAVSALFQSTPPARRATGGHDLRQQPDHGFNPRPPRGGRLDKACVMDAPTVFQSTPPARRATSRASRSTPQTSFQSTPPARRATPRRRCRATGSAGFNPRPPRGGRQDGRRQPRRSRVFQSTPPARRATASATATCRRPSAFQSTPPARRATLVVGRWILGVQVSIHAPRAEGDSKCLNCPAV